jgi:hypothetical protein
MRHFNRTYVVHIIIPPRWSRLRFGHTYPWAERDRVNASEQRITRQEAGMTIYHTDIELGVRPPSIDTIGYQLLYPSHPH